MSASPPEPVDLDWWRHRLAKPGWPLLTSERAEARTALPALVEELTALRAVCDAAEAVLDWAQDGQCKWCLRRGGSAHADRCPVGALFTAIIATMPKP